jgi:hypothetical protein
LNGEVVPVERVARWRPLFNWVLVIPAYLWLTILTYGSYAVACLAWFVIVITGRLPESFGNYMVAVLRYWWRVNSYLYGFVDRYPGFNAVAGYVDPGDYPALLYSARPTVRRRLSVAFRFILVIPQFIALWVMTIAAAAVLIAGWFVVLVIGRWPAGMREFVIGYLRWSVRVTAYWCLLVDVYPPFRLEA